MPTINTYMTDSGGSAATTTEKIKKLGQGLERLGATLTSVIKTVDKTATAVKNAGNVTQAAATLLDFDEIDRLVEKTASATKTAETTTKTKTGLSAETGKEKSSVTGLKGFGSKFWTQLTPSFSGTLSTVELWEEYLGQIAPFWERFKSWLDTYERVFGDIGKEHFMEVGAKLITTPAELWEQFKTGWGSPAVAIGNALANTASTLWGGFFGGWGTRSVGISNTLTNTASTLWSGFSGGWGTRGVGISNTLTNTASTLWSGFSGGWGTRGVSIVNTLANTASTLWTKFKEGWSEKSLALKISYTTNVGAVKTAVYKALGLSGWPSLSFAARGGIVETATLFGSTMVGEAGREAIIPLENHTEWMDGVAERIASKLQSGGDAPIVVQVTLDGRIVGQSTVNYIRSEARAGRAPLAGAV